MLVYLKEPMNYTSIDGVRVYGKKYAYGSMGPSKIKLETYKERPDMFIEAEYTKEHLEKIFQKEFPDVSFKLTELKKLSYKELSEVANLVGIKYSKYRRAPDVHELNALRRAVISAINRA